MLLMMLYIKQTLKIFKITKPGNSVLLFTRISQTLIIYIDDADIKYNHEKFQKLQSLGSLEFLRMTLEIKKTSLTICLIEYYNRYILRSVLLRLF
jgi:predicted phosphatase